MTECINEREILVRFLLRELIEEEGVGVAVAALHHAMNDEPEKERTPKPGRKR